MKSFEIKVSDLLNNPGQVDSLKLDHLISQRIPNLTKDGISGKLTLQSINDTTILVTVYKLSCKISDTCDKCLEDYDREVFCEEYKAKFEIPNEELMSTDDESSEKDNFIVNPKSETIDLEEFFRQAILLQEPFVKKCENCVGDEDSDEDEEYGPFGGKGNVVFS